ncbi:hypothetical protein IW16_19040 [Chryseobacterium vrystaatense]|uniref:Uncharacterized protein n=1 Tax=Chryseobacterium vrystaatense TaxID=307480 RepID=A0ABR4UI97_9FLAO|nr:hypothetical protein IW16_19040 [Chryseobacterium vrystaatense]
MLISFIRINDFSKNVRGQLKQHWACSEILSIHQGIIRYNGNRTTRFPLYRTFWNKLISTGSLIFARNDVYSKMF